MSTDNYGRRTCDGCYTPIVNAHRVHNKSEYCQKCYNDQFAKGICPECSGPTRYHVSESSIPPCGKCLRQKRPCGRCKRPTPRAARIFEVEVPGMGEEAGPGTLSMVVCARCVRYFRAPEPCDLCGEPSSDLARASHLEEGVRACPRCRTADTHATCCLCRKYRKIETTVDGLNHCKACSGPTAASHACPGCGLTVAGSGQSHCDDCLILSRLDREVELRLPLFEQPWLARLYKNFAEWSANRGVRTPRLPANVTKAVDFFLILDRVKDLRQPLTADAMVKVFSSKELRSNLNAATFLQQQFGFIIDGKARAEGQSHAIIEDKLAAAAGTPWYTYLASYRAWLADKPARTVAQYMGVAEAFCRQFQISGPFSQQELVEFLASKPGARTNLGPWVSFAQKQLGWPVTLPPKVIPPPALRTDAARLKTLLGAIGDAAEASTQDLEDVVALAFGFNRRELAKEVLGRSGERHLQTRNGPVEIPNAMAGLVATWLQRRGKLA